jgi:hypothetical protein
VWCGGESIATAASNKRSQRGGTWKNNTDEGGFFFYFGLFVIIIQEMNPAKCFPNLILLSRVNLSGATMKESHQSNWRDSNGWHVLGCHAGRDGATSYQSRLLGRHDWCLSRVSFGATQFPEYLAPSFSFFLLTFFFLHSLSTSWWLHW